MPVIRIGIKMRWINEVQGVLLPRMYVPGYILDSIRYVLGTKFQNGEHLAPLQELSYPGQ